MTGSAIVAQASRLLAVGRADAAVDLVSGAADDGDPDALYELALWRVYGSPIPRDFAAARDLFRRAGAAGHAAGALTHAVFIAMGAGAAADWPRALALLDTAARHDPAAARQRELIAAMTLKADGTPASVPPLKALSGSPRIGTIRALFTPEECAHVVALSRPAMQPSVVVDSRTGRQMPHPIRTSDGTVLGPIQLDLVTHALNLRIAAATGTQVRRGEPLSILRYTPGQQYRLHHDCLPGEANQRVLTLIAYLNGDYAGGATQFPVPGIDYRGEVGDAILFANTRSDGSVDERSRHAGLPVMRGEKWIATRWIRARDFDPWGLYAPSAV
jgi:prolyl 4-hydroxylase